MTGNFLLDALSAGDLDRIRPYLEPITLRLGDVVYAPGDGVTHVWFPLSGLLSVVSVLVDGTHVEGSAVGREAPSGSSRPDDHPDGSPGLRIPARRYRQASDSSAPLRKAVKQHIEAPCVRPVGRP